MTTFNAEFQQDIASMACNGSFWMNAQADDEGHEYDQYIYFSFQLTTFELLDGENFKHVSIKTFATSSICLPFSSHLHSRYEAIGVSFIPLFPDSG